MVAARLMAWLWDLLPGHRTREDDRDAREADEYARSMALMERRLAELGDAVDAMQGDHGGNDE